MVEVSSTRLLSDVVDAFCKLRYLNKPRTGFRYCNIAIELVGHIVSCLSGMDFADFVQQRILEPLGMRDTTWTNVRERRKTVQGYITTWKEDRLAEKIALPCIGLPRDTVLAPAGSMLSTASDLSKWLAFLIRLSKGAPTDADLKILKPEMLHEIIRSRVEANMQITGLPVEVGHSVWEDAISPTSYALCQVRATYRGVEIACHGGKLQTGQLFVMYSFPFSCRSWLCEWLTHALDPATRFWDLRLDQRGRRCFSCGGVNRINGFGSAPQSGAYRLE